MPVDVPESQETTTREVPPANSISSGEAVPPAMLRPHSPTEDLDHFNHAQVKHPFGEPRKWGLRFGEYSNYSGPPAIDPRNADLIVISEGIVRIVEVEGPVVAKRVFDIYLRSCGIRRMGHELKNTMNKALNHAIREGILVSEKEVNETDLVFSVVRTTGTPPIKLRTRGERLFEEIPPSELQVTANFLAQRHGFVSGSDEHLRTVLEIFDLKRLTTQVGTTLLEILELRFPYVDELINKMPR